MNIQKELKYLEFVRKEITQRMDYLSQKLNNRYGERWGIRNYIGENFGNMDKIEKIMSTMDLSLQEFLISDNKTELEKLQELFQKLCFGSINFECDDFRFEDLSDKFYIGKYNFSTSDEDILIYDWRSPIAGMFYKYETGYASYKTPIGKIISGRITEKENYRFDTDGNLITEQEFSNVDILQTALGNSAATQMKDIVATIQREQYSIIHNENYQIMVVQGVAGSGKTSIALHRIAYLLYTSRENKTNMQSQNVMILSPNNIFSDYISNVLPELGEIKTQEIQFYNFAQDELGNEYVIESPTKNNERIINGKNSEALKILNYKLSADFFESILKFVENFPANYVQYKDIPLDFISNYVKYEYALKGKLTITADYIKNYFESSKLPYFKRFDEIGRAFIKNVDWSPNTTAEQKQRAQQNVIERIKKICLMTDDILELYNDFLRNVSEKTGLELGIATKKLLKIEDAISILYLKLVFTGLSAKFDSIKHVVIDEMQDYSYIHFEIIKRMFPECQMTILGDINQVLVKREKNVLDVLKKIFPNSHIEKINKAYRSTFEITTFASKLADIKDIEPFDRHGKNPEIIPCFSQSAEFEQIKKICQRPENADKNIAIICKTVKAAESIYNNLKNTMYNLNLCVKENSNLKNGVTIITAFLAKGLEFDAVIVPDVDTENYADDIDRQILYISITRALHRLYILYSQKQSNLLAQV